MVWCSKGHKAEKLKGFAGLCVKHYRHAYYCAHKQLEQTRARNYKRDLYGRVYVTYQKLRLRCLGRMGRDVTARLYRGLPFLPQSTFVKWTWKTKAYLKLYLAWRESGYSLKLTPTIDRKDASKGYVLGNIRWLTFIENCTRPKRRTELTGRNQYSKPLKKK